MRADEYPLFTINHFLIPNFNAPFPVEPRLRFRVSISTSNLKHQTSNHLLMVKIKLELTMSRQRESSEMFGRYFLLNYQ